MDEEETRQEKSDIQTNKRKYQDIDEKMFRTLMNNYFAKSAKTERAENLFEDVKKGDILLAFLEVLSGEQIKKGRQRKESKEEYENVIINQALEFLEKKNIKFVNIHAEDISKGNPTIVLGLLWTMILHFHILSSRLCNWKEGRHITAKTSGKSQLLAFIQKTISRNGQLTMGEIKGFGKSWRDGSAFIALLNSIVPNLFNVEKVKKQTGQETLQTAFNYAEKYLGIPRLLDPQDIDKRHLDPKYIMMYVAEILNTYQNAIDDDSTVLTDQNICWIQHVLAATRIGGKYLQILLENLCGQTREKTLYCLLNENKHKHNIFHLWVSSPCCLCGPQKKNTIIGRKEQALETLFIRNGKKCKMEKCPHSYDVKPGVTTSSLDFTTAYTLLKCLFLNKKVYSLPPMIEETIEEIRVCRNSLVHMPDDQIPQFNFDASWLALKKNISKLCQHLKVSLDVLEKEMEDINRLAARCTDCIPQLRDSIRKYPENQWDYISLSKCSMCSKTSYIPAKSIIEENKELFMDMHPDEFLDNFETEHVLTREECSKIKYATEREKQMTTFLQIVEKKSETQCRHILDKFKSIDYGLQIRRAQRGESNQLNNNKNIHGNTTNNFRLVFEIYDNIGNEINSSQTQEKIIELLTSTEIVEKFRSMGIDKYDVFSGSIIVELHITGKENLKTFSEALEINRSNELVSSLWDRVTDIDEVKNENITLLSKMYPSTQDKGEGKVEDDPVESSAFLIDNNMEYLIEELNTKSLLGFLEVSNVAKSDLSTATYVRKHYPLYRRMQAVVLLDIFRCQPLSIFKDCLAKTQSQTLVDNVEKMNGTWLMALSTKLGKTCNRCKTGKVRHARFLCYQCHSYLCEVCSELHIHEMTEHNIIPLMTESEVPTHIQSQSTMKSKSTTALESNTESTKDTVIYRRNEVHGLESTTSQPGKHPTSKQTDHAQLKGTPSEPSKLTPSKQTDPRRLKATEYMQYNMKRPGDKQKVYVTGVLCVSHSVVVVDNGNKVLKLFDKSGTYLSSTASRNNTLGITCVGDGTFATCGVNTVDLWTVHEQTVVSTDVYHVDHRAEGIHYNGTYYCVIHNDNNKITVLNRQGGQVREITMVEACGKTFTFGWDIHMDCDTHNIYVPCRDADGVLCMTVEGRALWFTPLSWQPWGITEIQGTLCVADTWYCCLHVMPKEGEYVSKLLDKEDLGGEPTYVCYGQDGKLYVSYDLLSDRRDTIAVYTVT